MKLTPNQSHYVLDVLRSQGRVRDTHVRSALKGREEEIRNLRERLAALEQLSAGKAPGGGRRPRRGSRRATRRAPARRRRAPLSPRVRALRRLQGKYMGYVRRLKPAEKARVRTVREKQGMDAAIKLAQSLAKS